MSKAAQSIFIFGIYVMAAGLMLFIVPELVARALFLDPPADGWARLFGLIAAVLGFYYIFCARVEATGFFRATVYARPFVIFIVIGFVLLGLSKPGLILIGAIDFAGAIWTWRALRQDAKYR
jgi:hypothetical protein